MKKIIILLILLGISVSAYFYLQKADDNVTEEKEKTTVTEQKEKTYDEELRGVWVSCYEIKNMIASGNEDFTKNADDLLCKLSEFKINTVFFQVRAFSDALYSSKLFPSSKYIENADFDVLDTFISIAKEYNIDVHAWVNPYRVTYDNNIKNLSKENPAYKLYCEDKSNLIICEKGIYYNPASVNSQKLIIEGIKEIIENYNVSGVQFDDYFYPDCEITSDSKMYNNYKSNGGKLTLENWRKEQISTLVSCVYCAVKEKSQGLIFGISPSGKLEYNDNIYADVLKWCGCDGYIDYIMPQIYYGFENETMPFPETCEKWAEIERTDSVKLYCGLALYKCGKVDKNAGTGKNEWVENDTVISNQYKFLKKNNAFSGFSLFSSSYFVDENVTDNSKKEIKELYAVIE